MKSKTYPVRYDRQFEKFTGQFMRALSGIQIEHMGKDPSSTVKRRVGVVWGAMDRVVSGMMSNKSDHLVNQKIPLIAVNLSGIVPDASQRRNPYWNEPIPKRSLQKNDPKKTALSRIVGQSYTLTYEVNVLASSTSELFMIVEQLLMLFNPRLVIQSDTDIINADYITSVELESVQPDITYPLSQSSQVCVMSLGFSVPVRLRYPADRDSEVVEKIIANIMKEGDDVPVFTEEILGE